MTPVSKNCIKDMGLSKKKRNKICIPKEGMPHASACQKKREKKHTQRRYATCFGMSKKKRKKIKDAYPKKVCHMLRHVKKKKKEKK